MRQKKKPGLDINIDQVLMDAQQIENKTYL